MRWMMNAMNAIDAIDESSTRLAQLVERQTLNLVVGGSSPSMGKLLIFM